MKKITLLCGLLLAVTASVAAAGAGVGLRWNLCNGDGGVGNRNFACNSNAGTNAMVGTFEMGADLPGVVGTEIVIDLASADPTLPAWWGLRAGSCRPTSLTMNSTANPAAVNCLDWAAGAAAGGIGAYNIGLRGANTARIVAALAVAAAGATDLVPGQEYFSFNLNVNNAKTVGTGSCAGCQNPVCIVFNSIAVVQPAPLIGVKLTGPSNGTDSNFCTWQGGAGVTVPPGTWTGGGTGCPAATPTTNKTWGQVKTLYR